MKYAHTAKYVRAALIVTLTLLCVTLSLLVPGGVSKAVAQDAPGQAAIAAMKKLAFLNGTWNCTIHGGPSNGVVDRLNYSFAADGRWMIERSDIQGAAPAQSSVQVWGYDPAQRGLVGYQFTQTGVATKTVSGWNGDTFTSTRNDTGATVSLKQTGPNAISWIIHSAGTPTSDVTEDCTR